MERQQLARRYLDGQMGRRVFLRRLIGLGVALPAAIAYADLLQADPAAAAGYDYYVGVQEAFFPTPLRTAAFGQTIEWGFWGSVYAHTATDPTLVINSGPKTPWNIYDQRMSFSGTFRYRCTETIHPLMSGVVKVPMAADPTSGALGTSFSLNWSITPGLAEYSFDVQRKGPSDSLWQKWITATSTRAAIYVPPTTGIYAFRARVRNTASGKVSGWSPVKKITVT